MHGDNNVKFSLLVFYVSLYGSVTAKFLRARAQIADNFQRNSFAFTVTILPIIPVTS
jgi:hypothetical protein